MAATLTTRVTALESDVAEIKTGVQAILAALNPTAPAKAAVVEPKAVPCDVRCGLDHNHVEPSEFVGWLRETAEARKARKASNAEMAAWMRSKGLTPNGAAWEAAKKGERSVRTLKALQAKDA